MKATRWLLLAKKCMQIVTKRSSEIRKASKSPAAWLLCQDQLWSHYNHVTEYGSAFIFLTASIHLVGHQQDHLHLKAFASYFGNHWLIEQGLTSQQTHYRSYWERVFTSRMTQPTMSKHWRKTGFYSQMKHCKRHSHICYCTITLTRFLSLFRFFILICYF